MRDQRHWRRENKRQESNQALINEYAVAAEAVGAAEKVPVVNMFDRDLAYEKEQMHMLKAS